MQNSRLVATLRTLNKTEWRSFRKYLDSPFFNQRADVIALAGFLHKELSKPVADQSFDQARAWQKMYPPLKYDEKQLRYTRSYLLDRVEDFLALSDLKTDLPAHSRLVVNALRKRGLVKGTEPHPFDVPAARDGFDRAVYRTWPGHVRALAPQRPSEGAGYPLADHIRQFTFDMLMETLRAGCAFLDTLAPPADPLPFPWLQAVLDFCEKERLPEQSPSLAMLYHTYRMLEKMPSGEGAEHFFGLKKMLDADTTIPQLLRRESWLRAVNFAIRRQNLGDKKFGREAFALYQSGIDNGLILENGRISKKAYYNTLVLALLNGEGAWAEAFLKKYQAFLPEHERDNTYRHSLATLFFKQQQFEKVLETLQHVSFTDSLHNLDDRRLLLCSYYELGEWSALDSLLDSFGIWLRRAKNLGYHRELYANLVKFTRRLVDVQHQNRSWKEKLKQEILATENVAAKEWLLEKWSGMPLHF